MLKFICALGFALLAGSIIWAFGRAPFWPAVAEITANPWGIVTLIDLYLGFLIFSIVLWRFEPSRPLAIGLIAAASRCWRWPSSGPASRAILPPPWPMRARIRGGSWR
ncbi:MAG: hypothetical protein MUC44_04360 [Beijerinckiaceae bacterium]|nr:hypothetical protein [Beijerinckiaceae bacterium]